MSPAKVLSNYKESLGSDYHAYLNHVKRVYEYACMLRLERDSDLFMVAAIFHDLDIWRNSTMNYLPGSIELALDHIAQNNLPIDKATLSLVIKNHHKIRKIKNSPEAEAFRKADLIDLTSGWIKFNIPKSIIIDTERRYPRLGITKVVLQKVAHWAIRHPFKPFPMMKL